VVDICFSVWGSGGAKILLLIIEWVLDVLPDFGMGFLSQDLIFWGWIAIKCLGERLLPLFCWELPGIWG